MDQRFPIPSRAVLDQQMEALLVELKGKVAVKLQDCGKVAICTDIWSRKGMTQSFLGITAHFFTKSDHRRRVATLAVKLLPSPHTGEAIEEAVRNGLLEWEIPERKISAILTDNGSNMIAAFKDWILNMREMENEVDEEEDHSPQSPAVSHEESSDDGSDPDPEMDMDLQVSAGNIEAAREIEEFDQQELQHDISFSVQKRLPCFNHTLQLVVKKFDTVQSSKRALLSAHKIVRKFSKSVKATEKLVARCGLKLMSDCPTRWNSTYLMVSRLLAVRPHVTEVLQELEWDGRA